MDYPCDLSIYQDLGIPMKVEIQSDSTTANSLTDRLVAGQRTKHFDTRYFWVQERVQDGDLSIKKVPTAKNCADVGIEASPCFCTTTTLQVCRDWYSNDPTPHYEMKGDDPNSGSGGSDAETDDVHDHVSRRMCELSGMADEFDISHDERIKTATARARARCKATAMAQHWQT